MINEINDKCCSASLTNKPATLIMSNKKNHNNENNGYSTFFLLNNYRQTLTQSVLLALIYWLLLLSDQSYQIHCLQITLLDIPTPLVVGESAELTCNYDLGDNVLYSFKWYKDGIEFYR